MSIRISVVIPTYERPDLIARCLEALARQDFPADEFEIVVADDGASARIETLVQTMAQRLRAGPRLRYVAVTGTHGPAAARNTGWRAASAEVIAFTDDDTVPERDWLSQGMKAIAQADAVSGWVVVPIPDPPTDYELDAHGLEGAEFVTANCFVRRAALERIDGFDERFRRAWREDSDLYFTLLEHRQRVIWEPRARVLHPVRPAGFGVSLRQQSKIAFDALLYKKHPRLYRSKIRATSPWRYYLYVLALVAMIVGLASGSRLLSVAAAAVWAGIAVAFCLRRLEKTSRAPRHMVEMLLTSFAIPAVAVFWRLVGAARFRVLFL
jgi:glycosyltransferase involved in cell wall biosynthesis